MPGLTGHLLYRPTGTKMGACVPGGMKNRLRGTKQPSCVPGCRSRSPGGNSSIPVCRAVRSRLRNPQTGKISQYPAYESYRSMAFPGFLPTLGP